MNRAHVLPFLLVATTLTACTGLNLSPTQQQAISSLVGSAGLRLETTDIDGNPVTIGAGDIAGISINGQRLTADQFGIDGNGNLSFKNVISLNQGTIPVIIQMKNGGRVAFQFDTSSSAIASALNAAVFVPGADGQYHLGATGQSPEQAWQAQHAADLTHRVTLETGLKDIDTTKPMVLGLKVSNPDTSDAPITFMIPPSAYDVDANGNLQIDAPVFCLTEMTQALLSNFVASRTAKGSAYTTSAIRPWAVTSVIAPIIVTPISTSASLLFGNSLSIIPTRSLPPAPQPTSTPTTLQPVNTAGSGINTVPPPVFPQPTNAQLQNAQILTAYNGMDGSGRTTTITLATGSVPTGGATNPTNTTGNPSTSGTPILLVGGFGGGLPAPQLIHTSGFGITTQNFLTMNDATSSAGLLGNGGTARQVPGAVAPPITLPSQSP